MRIAAMLHAFRPTFAPIGPIKMRIAAGVVPPSGAQRDSAILCWIFIVFFVPRRKHHICKIIWQHQTGPVES